MGRPRKVPVEALTASEVVSGEAFVEKQEVIQPIAVDFGREDLNNLGNKINEIIQYINNN
jgi:hypothetical protein